MSAARGTDERAPVTAPRRILVVRLSAIGDVVVTTGLIPALGRLWPGAQITWLVEAVSAPLLTANPRLDEVLIWPRGPWQQLWQERRLGELWRQFRAFRLALRERRFDLAIDAQGLIKSALWCCFSGAPRRISVMGYENSGLLMSETVRPAADDDRRMIGFEYRALIEHLGGAPDSYQLDLAVNASARDAAQAQLGALGIAEQAPLAVLCPFTTRPQKHWFEDRWAELARALRADGFVPVLLGGPGDREAAERIAAQAPELVDLAGKLPLGQSVAVIERAKLLIGVDTGLTHMGSALHVPTVALFGSTRPYLDAGLGSTRVLYTSLACSPCHRHPTCGGRFDCMREHPVAEVRSVALRLVGS
jgi:heptosyltransferase I